MNSFNEPENSSPYPNMEFPLFIGGLMSRTISLLVSMSRNVNRCLLKNTKLFLGSSTLINRQFPPDTK